MYDEEQVMELKVMGKQGRSLKAIARESGASRNTVRKYVRDGNGAVRQPRASRLDPHLAWLDARLQEAPGISAAVLQRELAARGVAIGGARLRQVVAARRPKAPPAPLVRFETEPGVQAQIDFATFTVGTLVLKAFVAVLGYSRWLYVQFFADERIEQVRAGHEAFFAALGGVPQRLLYDNARTVVIARDAQGRGKHRFQPALWELAAHYGFVPKLCQPYRPQTKGKVERAIRYLRENFFLPTVSTLEARGEAITPETLNASVATWLREVANARVHRDLKTRPCERLVDEQSQLLPLPMGSCGQTLRQLVPALIVRSAEALQRPLAHYQAVQEAA